MSTLYLFKNPPNLIQLPSPYNIWYNISKKQILNTVLKTFSKLLHETAILLLFESEPWLLLVCSVSKVKRNQRKLHSIGENVKIVESIHKHKAIMTEFPPQRLIQAFAAIQSDCKWLYTPANAYFALRTINKN